MLESTPFVEQENAANGAKCQRQATNSIDGVPVLLSVEPRIAASVENNGLRRGQNGRKLRLFPGSPEQIMGAQRARCDAICGEFVLLWRVFAASR